MNDPRDIEAILSAQRYLIQALFVWTMSVMGNEHREVFLRNLHDAWNGDVPPVPMSTPRGDLVSEEYVKAFLDQLVAILPCALPRQ